MNEYDRQWLIDMLEYSREAMSLLGPRGAAELEADRRTLLAVSFALQTIGEAATRVSPEGQVDLAGIPWRQIIGMRHRLVHGYRATSTALIVDTVRNHLPSLIETLEQTGLDAE